jgi:hypothetical protein
MNVRTQSWLRQSSTTPKSSAVIGLRLPLNAGTVWSVTASSAIGMAFMLDPRNTWITGADLVVDGGYTLH